MALAHAKRIGQASSFGPGQVLGLLEHLLERIDLLAVECGPRVLATLAILFAVIAPVVVAVVVNAVIFFSVVGEQKYKDKTIKVKKKNRYK